jgi:hypothetical protein
MSELAGSRCKLLHHELTGSYVFTFQADSDDVVPKSASRRSLLISSKSVSGPRGSAEGLKDYFRIADNSLGTG